MRWIPVVALLLLPQEAEDPALQLHRTLEKHRAAATETEQKERLASLCDDMRQGARRSLKWEMAADDEFALQLYDVRGIVTMPADRPCPEFGGAPPGGPLEGFFGAEMVVDYIKELASPGIWEGEHTLELTPGGELLVNTFPRVHRQVARLLRLLEADFTRQVSATITLLAMPAPRALDLAAEDGTVTDEALERLMKEADVKRLESVDLRAQTCQLVSASSGVEHSYVAAIDAGKPVLRAIRDGLAVELRPVVAGSRVEVHGRLRFRAWCGTDELKTPLGSIQAPRVAEVDLHIDRSAPSGRAIVLGRAGPLAPETKLPAFVVVIARFGPAK